MWNNNNNGSQDHLPPRRSSSHTPNEQQRLHDTSSPEYAAAAALARRMVYPNAYDAPPRNPPPGGYYEDSLPMAWQHPPPPRGHHHRAREMELLRLQQLQEMQDHHAYEEEAARRNRLLELELSVNQMQEYERCRMQIEMMRDMQHHEMDDRRLGMGQGAGGSPYEANSVRQHQIAEYLAGQRSRAVEDDAEAWRTLNTNSHSSRRSPQGTALLHSRSEEFSSMENSRREVAVAPTNETVLKMERHDVESDNDKMSPAVTAAAIAAVAVAPPEKKKRKRSDSGDATAAEAVAAKKKTAPASPKKKAAAASTDSPKKKAASPKKPTKATATDNPSKSSSAKANGSDSSIAKINGEVKPVEKKKASNPSPSPSRSESDTKQPDSKQTASAPPEKTSTKKKSPEAEPKEKPAVTTIAPVEKHASKTLAHLKTIQESQATPAKTAKSSASKRKKTPTKKMDVPDKPTSSSSKSKKKSPSSKSSTPSPASIKVKLATPKMILSHPSLKRSPGVPTVDDVVPPITDVQYENVEGLMNEFCRVPFLAEFSRPVSLLHPELMTLYSKIVHHPMDLGHVCRAIRRRQYKNTRSIQLDMWRIFSNCVKFHTHPSNRENAIPSFVSIANHLRDFFNNLWQEFMMSSDAPPRQPGKGISHVHSAYQKRAEARKERMVPISSTRLSGKCMRKVADALENFVSSGGKVDNFDKDCILGKDVGAATGDVATFIQSIRELIASLEEKIESGEEYVVSALHRDLKKTFTEDVFATEVLKRMRIGSRLDRLFWKIFAPVHEVTCRGVNQSSIWGNMAAIIWARESKKKPFWPAIVLGMMAPEDQKEDWHESLTEQNEGRLPEKLREELQLGKRRAEQALKKQTAEPMSHFLVEFMGSHEFIWVRETDIVETFDPEVDPNVASAAGNVTKKRRSAHSNINPKMMSDAIEEGRWVLEEFEIRLSDTCGDHSDDEGEFDDGLTYDIMCQSDDEADELDKSYARKANNDSDVEEQNELLLTNGCPDFSIEGRKKAKARAAENKKQKAQLLKQEKTKETKAKKSVSAKKTPSKSPDPTEDHMKQLAKQLEEEEKRVEARRKKRLRDHERSLKELEKQAKKSKSTPDKRPNSLFVPEKKARADAFVKSFLIHKHKANSDFHGAPFVPTNSVEPTGLLGMSLAFRGASGDISFTDHKGREFIQNPWDKIDATAPKESSQRCQLLQEQIDLIEKEIQKVNTARDKRSALHTMATIARDAAHQKYIDAGDKVRSTKKVFTSSSKKKKLLAKPKPDVDKSGDDDDTSGRTPNDGAIHSGVSTPDVKSSQVEGVACNSPSQNGHVQSVVETNLRETSSYIESSFAKSHAAISDDQSCDVKHNVTTEAVSNPAEPVVTSSGSPVASDMMAASMG